jgi:hypothetical protein
LISQQKSPTKWSGSPAFRAQDWIAKKAIQKGGLTRILCFAIAKRSLFFDAGLSKLKCAKK